MSKIGRSSNYTETNEVLNYLYGLHESPTVSCSRQSKLHRERVAIRQLSAISTFMLANTRFRPNNLFCN